MAEMIEQDEDLTLQEGEEYGNIEDLQAGADEPQEDVVEDEVAETEEDVVIPEKFKGKSASEIAKSYEELEKAFGRKNNEVGELRKLTDDILKQSLQLNNGTPAAADSSTKIEVDDLLEDPNKAINSALESNPRLKQLEEQLLAAKRAEAEKGFEQKHPDGQALVASPEFQNWVAESPARQRLFMEAHQNYDYDLADELLSTYKLAYGNKVQDAQVKQKANRDKAFKEGSVEKGSSGQAPKKIYKRQDLLRMMSTNRDAYDDPVFQAELTKAYQEGRVR